MRVVDTSAWLEWLMETPLQREIGKHLPTRQEWVVPTIVQLELSKWLSREVGETVAEEAIGFTQQCVVVPLTSELAVAAAEACRRHQLSSADAVIYATALAREADLLTCDKHFEGLPGVVYIPKAGN